METLDTETSRFVLRKFIANARHFRMVVIGDKVVDTIEYIAPDDDFRTNAVAVPQVLPRNDASDDLKRIAAHATNALGLEFGGVDVLIDTEGNAYIAEVNFPCNFARNQMCTGTDIAGQMIDYLVAKAESRKAII